MNPVNLDTSLYLPILVFFVLMVGVAFVIICFSLFLGEKKPSKAKLSPYECGFESISDVRKKIDIKFYLLAMLFIIFDIEISFLIPWAVSLGTIGKVGFWSMMVFLFMLTIGFIYEWKKGALEWT